MDNFYLCHKSNRLFEDFLLKKWEGEGKICRQGTDVSVNSPTLVMTDLKPIQKINAIL